MAIKIFMDNFFFRQFGDSEVKLSLSLEVHKSPLAITSLVQKKMLYFYIGKFLPSVSIL